MSEAPPQRPDFKANEPDIDRAIEIVLTAGLALSGVLLLVGLLSGGAGPLKWGIVILMLTPVARVVVVTVALFHEGDRLFGVISLLILGILATSLAVAVWL